MGRVAHSLMLPPMLLSLPLIRQSTKNRSDKWA